jgi:bifunctional NMN adenylyltransferase/nudix hydrolase
MEIKRVVNPNDYSIGCIIARFQVHKLHPSQRELVEDVCKNHKKVILFLGIPPIHRPETDPLDFATRKAMLQNDYPNVIILPVKDNRDDNKWSKNIDEQIDMTFNGGKALLYGSRDSFIPHYHGKHQTVELITDTFYSGTEVRKEVTREILGSSDFRAGVIYGKADRYPTAYNTVDVACVNNEGKVLLAKKPNENKLRFIGGFVDPSDNSKERAAKREFSEETGGCEIGDLRYVCSQKIDDWRYRRAKDGIMSTLFVGTFIFGSPIPTDDICELSWVLINDLKKASDKLELHNIIMEEHVELMENFLNSIKL